MRKIIISLTIVIFLLVLSYVFFTRMTLETAVANINYSTSEFFYVDYTTDKNERIILAPEVSEKMLSEIFTSNWERNIFVDPTHLINQNNNTNTPMIRFYIQATPSGFFSSKPFLIDGYIYLSDSSESVLVYKSMGIDYVYSTTTSFADLKNYN